MMGPYEIIITCPSHWRGEMAEQLAARLANNELPQEVGVKVAYGESDSDDYFTLSIEREVDNS